MNRRLVQGLGALTLGFAVLGPCQAEGDVAAGKIKTATCLGCHGVASYTNVYPTYHVPKLGGQHADYIVAALKAYKNGERDHETMRAQAGSLSDQDMADIAAYLTK
jgi:cytochrome c553